MMRYELHYWPTIQGRGEFVRLALEEAGADYVDVARLTPRQGGGEAALLRRLADKDVAPPPFAPPFLKAGRLVTHGSLPFVRASLLFYKSQQSTRQLCHTN